MTPGVLTTTGAFNTTNSVTTPTVPTMQAARTTLHGLGAKPRAGTRTVPVTAAPEAEVHRAHTTLPPLALDGGASLEAPVLAWTMIGQPNAARDNVIVVAHALTGTADVHEWWRDLVGDGRALDTSRHAVLCANALGGCAGSSGPRTGDTTPFPALSTRDQARALRSLLDALQIDTPRLLVGGSLGGMVALELAALDPRRVREVVVFAAPTRQTALGAGWHALMRAALAVGGPRDGLALARMAGMLSYRAAEGLEQRFGARGSAGSAQVSAWLSHHGERLVSRFDAASYGALIDAMDRHDVTRDRGTLRDALGPCADRITGVGIPGDLLYPHSVVEAWTQELGARYLAIDSPHGHDAFLLEVPQVERILRDALQRANRSRPAARDTVRIALAGCGVVGDAFAAAVARGALAGGPCNEVTFSAVLVRDRARSRAGFAEAVRARCVHERALTTDAHALLAAGPTVLVEALGGIEPARELVERALRRGVPVVTANKELVAAHGPELVALAAAHHTSFDLEGSVCASVPVIRWLRHDAPRSEVQQITAILNGTTNFVLDALADGAALADAVRLAQAAGYAEADPSRDLDGSDIEAKARILGWLAFGVSPKEIRVQRRGLDAAVARWATAAARQGDRVRLLTTIERRGDGVHAHIEPTRVRHDSEWGAVRGVQNRVVIRAADGLQVRFEGPGAGGEATARALIADVSRR